MHLCDNCNITFINSVVGKFIRRERKKKGLSGYALSLLIGISQQQISRYERGACRISMGMMLFILNKMNIPLDELLIFIREETGIAGSWVVKNEHIYPCMGNYV